MNDHPAPITLETERLWLRPTGIQDAAFWLQLVNSPKWLRHVGDRQVRTEEDARQYIRERMEPQLSRYGYGNFTFLHKPDGREVGVCGLYKRDGLDAVDIGFAILPEWEGRGLTREAARAVMDAAFRVYRLPLLCAITTPENHASRRILESLGMSFLRMIRIPGDEADLRYYEKRHPDFRDDLQPENPSPAQ